MFDQFVIFCAQYLPFLILGVAVIFFIRLERSRQVSVLALFVISSGIAFVADKILNRLVESPRPFMVNDIAPLFPHSIDNGFPSEHVLLAIVVAGVVFAYNRKLGVILAILGLVVGSARVIANVHHPIDIIGGAAIALISIFCAHWVLSTKKVQNFLIKKIAK